MLEPFFYFPNKTSFVGFLYCIALLVVPVGRFESFDPTIPLLPAVLSQREQKQVLVCVPKVFGGLWHF